MNRIGIILLGSVFYASIGLAQAPQVISVMPAQNELSAPGSTNISVTFDTHMDEETINESSFVVTAGFTGFHPGQVTYDNITRTATLDPIDDFDTGEPVTVVLTSEIHSYDGEPLEAGYIWSFTVAVFNGTASFGRSPQYSVDGGPAGISLADLDNDGDNDIVFAKWAENTVSILSNTGDGTFESYNDYPVRENPGTVIAGDLEPDGDIDIVCANWESNDITVLLNNGEFEFPISTTYDVGNHPSGIIIADLDADGDNDIANVNYSSHDVTILFNIGNGAFDSAYASYGIGTNPRSVSAADFDNDGDTDLVGTVYVSGSLSVLLNDGDGTFTDGGLYTVPDPIWVSAADLNGDGYCDLAATNYQAGNVSILLNNGEGIFDDQMEYTAGDDRWKIETCDFDGDGDLDIATTAYEGELSILLNDGDGTFGSPAMEISARTFDSADIDGDGDLDMAAINSQAHRIYILKNYGSTLAEPEEHIFPDKLSLNQNYPNPFNAETEIVFSLPMSGRATIKICNIAGRQVRSFANNSLDAGVHRIIWDGTNDQMAPIASGIYIYTLEFNNTILARKMLLLK